MLVLCIYLFILLNIPNWKKNNSVVSSLCCTSKKFAAWAYIDPSWMLSKFVNSCLILEFIVPWGTCKYLFKVVIFICCIMMDLSYCRDAVRRKIMKPPSTFHNIVISPILRQSCTIPHFCFIIKNEFIHAVLLPESYFQLRSLKRREEEKLVLVCWGSPQQNTRSTNWI